MTKSLDLLDLRKVRFEGKLSPHGKKDWRLTAKLGATVIQPCVATLEPVTTRIEEKVERQFLAELPSPSGDELEMLVDDMIESLPEEINLEDVLEESLALALPDYPRRADIEPIQTGVAEAGIAPMTDEEIKPFAGLASLRDKLANKDHN